MSGQQMGLMLVALAVALAAASTAWQWIRRRRRFGVVEEFLREVSSPGQVPSVGPCGHELPGYGTNLPTSCDLAAGHPGSHRDDAGTTWSRGTRAQDDALAAAARLLHARRHHASTAPCGRCRADVETVAPAFGWPA